MTCCCRNPRARPSSRPLTARLDVMLRSSDDTRPRSSGTAAAAARSFPASPRGTDCEHEEAVQREMVQHPSTRATSSATTTSCSPDRRDTVGAGQHHPVQLAQSTPTGLDGTVPGGVYPQRFGIPEGLYAEPVAVKQGWFCCWNGANWVHVSTGVIGPDRRYVMAIGSMDPTSEAAARNTSPRRSRRCSRRPHLVAVQQVGARSRVRCSACSRRHAAILAWSPESSTSARRVRASSAAGCSSAPRAARRSANHLGATRDSRARRATGEPLPRS